MGSIAICDSSWSDAAQQLTPAAFGEMLDHLEIRQVDSSNREFQTFMEQSRRNIDNVDRQLIEMVEHFAKSSRR